VLIANVHGDPGQVIAMVLISMAALAGLLSTLYLVDRLGIWRAPANVN
jgi:hypothetical protein